jgi:hypothetical protein
MARILSAISFSSNNEDDVIILGVIKPYEKPANIENIQIVKVFE